MQRLFCIPLLGIAPFGYFLGPYLSGFGILSWNAGFIVGIISVFVCPWAVSISFVIFYKLNLFLRAVLFVATLSAQLVFTLDFVPPAATSELMGMAHRLRHEYSPEQLRDCADQLRAEFHAGTLKRGNISEDDGDYFPVFNTALIVADTELPTSLCGRFHCVFIQADPSTGSELVIFAFDHETGIICGKLVPTPNWAYPMADGVEVYQDHP